MSGQPGFDLKVFGPFGAMLGPFFTGSESDQAQGASSQLAAQSSKSFKAVGRYQLEIMGLANRRVQAYMQFPTRLSQCRTPQDVLEAQLEFWQGALAQYAESSRRMMEVLGDMTPGLGAFRQVPHEHDYINFTSGREAEPRPVPAPRAGQSQRRVA